MSAGAAPARPPDRPVAVTGGTGFVGRHVVTALLERQVPVRMLVRRPAAALPGTHAVTGDLADRQALRVLVEEARGVIHCAGVVAAPSAAGFRAANVEGTAALLSVLPQTVRVVHVSSLAVRAPELSHYAESKRAAEALVTGASVLECRIVRPPAVYGPGDRATLPIISAMARGRLLMPAPANGRFSLIYVRDLARLLALLAIDGGDGPDLLEPDDGYPGGYDWPALAAMAAQRLGRHVRYRRLPPALVWPVAAAGDLWGRLSGRPAMLTVGKLRELGHADWRCRIHALPSGWRPEVQFAEGFDATLAWYREKGWL